MESTEIKPESSESTIKLHRFKITEYLHMHHTLLGIIEELKIRRYNDLENEDRIQFLVKEKYELVKNYDIEVRRNTILDQQHQKKLQELQYQYEEKFLLIQEQMRQLIFSEQKEEEIKALKDEVRNLQLSKYMADKRLKEQEQELQLQKLLFNQHLEHLADVDKKFTSVSMNVQKLMENQKYLERSVQEAKALNQRLTYINEHQKCLMSRYISDGDNLQKQMLELNLRMKYQPAIDNQTQLDFQMKISQLQQQIDQVKNVKEDYFKELEECQKKYKATLNSLADAHQLLEQHVTSAKMYKSEVMQAHAQLQQQNEHLIYMTQQLDNVSNDLSTKKMHYKDAAEDWEKKELKLISQMEQLSDDLVKMTNGNMELADLNSQWSEENMNLKHMIELLQAKVDIVKIEISTQTKWLASDKTTQLQPVIASSFCQTALLMSTQSCQTDINEQSDHSSQTDSSWTLSTLAIQTKVLPNENIIQTKAPVKTVKTKPTLKPVTFIDLSDLNINKATSLTSYAQNQASSFKTVSLTMKHPPIQEILKNDSSIEEIVKKPKRDDDHQIVLRNKLVSYSKEQQISLNTSVTQSKSPYYLHRFEVGNSSFNCALNTNKIDNAHKLKENEPDESAADSLSGNVSPLSVFSQQNCEYVSETAYPPLQKVLCTSNNQISSHRCQNNKSYSMVSELQNKIRQPRVVLNRLQLKKQKYSAITYLDTNSLANPNGHSKTATVKEDLKLRDITRL